MKIKKLFISIIALTILSVVPVHAEEMENVIKSERAQQENTVLLPEGSENSFDSINNVGRSSIISSASSEIIDETGGDIGVIIQTLVHVECQQIRNIAIVERYKEENDSWVEVARYDFIANKDDFPTQPLTSLTNSFTVENQETGYYYRVRGIHSISTLDGRGQVYSTRTDGLLITEYGR